MCSAFKWFLGLAAQQAFMHLLKDKPAEVIKLFGILFCGFFIFL